MISNNKVNSAAIVLTILILNNSVRYNNENVTATSRNSQKY
eukprot:SAG31_NODE_2012_length_6668_cov_5.925407_10_plen_41_part_00